MDTDFLPDTGFVYPTPEIRSDPYLARSDFFVVFVICRPTNEIIITV